eukprot:7809086-Alexandrium_andersonii.AAC.1
MDAALEGASVGPAAAAEPAGGLDVAVVPSVGAVPSPPAEHEDAADVLSFLSSAASSAGSEGAVRGAGGPGRGAVQRASKPVEMKKCNICLELFPSDAG